MSEHYTEGTGSIKLVKITPIIKAFFDTYNLEVSSYYTDLAYLSFTSDDTWPNWDDIHHELISLANEYGLTLPSDSDGSVSEYLYLLSEHFGCEDNPLFENIDNYDFQDGPDLRTVFDLVALFNDGHDIQHVEVEQSWYCTKLEPGQFGGHGQFISKHVDFSAGSQQARVIIQPIHEAINNGKLDDAACLVKQGFENFFSSILDDEIRQEVRQKVIEALTSSQS